MTFHLAVRHLGRRSTSEGEWLLRDISMDVKPGDRWAIVGPSGAGKTLLLRTLAQLDPFDAGAIQWNDQTVEGAKIPAYRAQVVYLHQKPTLFEGTIEGDLRRPWNLTVHRNKSFDRLRAVELLQRLGRDESFLQRKTDDLSGGEAQIVAVVRVLLLKPSILLLDEPTASLDVQTEQALEQLILEFAQESGVGRGIVWVSHDPDQSRRIANRTLSLARGRLEEGV